MWHVYVRQRVYVYVGALVRGLVRRCMGACLRACVGECPCVGKKGLEINIHPKCYLVDQYKEMEARMKQDEFPHLMFRMEIISSDTGHNG